MIDYESPLFVDIVLYVLYVLLALAVVLTTWSVVRGLRMRGKEGGVEHQIPARRIALLTAALLVVTMAVTWLLGSTKPLSINGKIFADAFWLRTSDMLIMTPAILFVVLLFLGAVGAYRSYRLFKEK